MPTKNETTTKFKVDISELKKGIQEANRQIRLANAEFKAASSGMENWGKSSDGLNAKIGQLKTVLGAQNSVLDNYKKQLALVVTEEGESSKGADELRIKIANQQAAVNKTTAEIKKYETQLNNLEQEQRESAKAANVQESAFDSLQKEIKEQESDLEKLKKEYANVVLTQGKNSDAAKELASQIDNLSSELSENKKKLNDAEKAADDFDNSLENTTSGGLNAFTVALGNLIANVISSAISKMKELVSSTIEVGRAFDSSMSQVAAVSGATAKDVELLRKKAKQMGATTKFTASEAADAFNYMAMAGWKTEDMLGGIDGILNLAAASGADLATTSDIVTDALTALRYSAQDAGKLADVMAAASSNANTNVEMMGETFKYVAPVAGAMGYSMEDVALSIGLMANAGIKGSQAGTSLRSMLSRLAAPPKECADAMDKMGLSITNADGTMKPLNQILTELRSSFSGLSESEQAAMAKHIAGQEAMSGLLAIVNAAPEDFDKLTKAIGNSEGTAAQMADTMLDNLGGDMTLTQSNLESLQLMLYEKFEPALRKGTKALNGLINAFKWLLKNGTKVKAVIVGVTTAVGVFMTIIKRQAILTAFTNGITAMKTAFLALNATMAANPIGLVIAAISGLVAAFVVLWNNSEEFREFWIGLWEKIKEVAVDVWENYLKPVVTAIGEAFTALWENYLQPAFATIGEAFQTLFEHIVNLWETYLKPAFEAIGNTFMWLWENALQPTLGFIQEAFTTVFNAIKTTWEKVLKPAFEAIASVFKWLWEVVLKVILIAMATAFTTVWKGIETAWNKILKPVFNAIGSVFKFMWEKVLKPVLDLFKDVFTKLFDGIKNIWDTVLKPVFQAIGDTFKTIWEDYLEPTIDAIIEAFTTMGDAIGDVWDTLWNKILKPIINSILAGMELLANGVVKGINTVIDALNNLSFEVPDWVPGIGGEEFGFNIGKLDEVSLPRLVQGGVLKRGQVGLLEGSGAEAVVPLEHNKRWIAATVKELKGSLAAEGLLSGGTGKNPVNNNYSYNFTQNNNSPKALSRLEIYRRTRNQLNFAKGMQ